MNDINGLRVEEAADYLSSLVERGCNGYVTATRDGVFVFHEDGESCPVHESDTPPWAPERPTETANLPPFDALAGEHTIEEDPNG
jgi:hypothetical protein